MGLRAKTKRQMKRRQEKRARKEQQKARFAAYRESGDNSKRSKLRRKRALAAVRTVSHPDGKCGNPGCVKCHGVFFAPFLVDGKPRNMPQKLYKRWVATQVA